MSLKNQEKQQNEFTQDSPRGQESYECNETISDISLEFNQQKLVRQCQCMCRCAQKTSQAFHQLQKKEKKRLKRKNNKMKLKDRQKELQQKALNELQQIIKDIYALKTNFEDVHKQVQACISIQINRDKFYDFINSIIRIEVERIRQEIVNNLNLLQTAKDIDKKQMIKGLFQKMQVIKKASPEIQKIINLFVGVHFDPQFESPPYQNNLDQLTFSFLIKNYLQKSESFVILCELIFEKQEYSEQRELFQIMMNAFNRYDPQEFCSEDQYSDSGYDSEQWQLENAKRTINLSLPQQESESKSRRRRQRKRKTKQQHEQNYESIVRRMQQMDINESERVNCNIGEDWIKDIIKKRQQYVKIINNPFNMQ